MASRIYDRCPVCEHCSWPLRNGGTNNAQLKYSLALTAMTKTGANRLRTGGAGEHVTAVPKHAGGPGLSGRVKKSDVIGCVALSGVHGHASKIFITQHSWDDVRWEGRLGFTS